jgi:hypothetical protein
MNSISITAPSFATTGLSSITTLQGAVQAVANALAAKQFTASQDAYAGAQALNEVIAKLRAIGA